MKRLDRRVPRYSACLIVLATVAVWPTAGWSQTCSPNNFKTFVEGLLQNWADKLKFSWAPHIDPGLIGATYAPDAVLLPTCSKGPLDSAGIRHYFEEDFLPLKPEATFDWDNNKIGGDCSRPFASGLYLFDLFAFKPEKHVQARYTYVFKQMPGNVYLIEQHHSSLVPTKPAQECPKLPSKR